ncbi:MAG: hypothetical protein HYX71_08925 [Opitutae bacterium]|nr:hypothetical protein [Opitutae bacterium]
MMFSQRQFLILGGGIAVLLGGIVLQWVNVRDVKKGDRAAELRPVGLAERMPVTLAGWKGRDEPLGLNEATRSAAERVLNYDDYVFRVFEKDSRQVGVYIAYWAAGRMPMQKVASHTPDRCWTENGWRCEDMRFAEPVGVGELHLRPAQWRRFTPPNGAAMQYVVYWHLVGDRLYDYGTRFNSRPAMDKWWRDTLEYAFSGSEAQYFIRVTSNQPFEELKGDPGWEELLGALAKLGLAAR